MACRGRRSGATTGTSLPTTFNALAIAVNAWVWLPGIAWLSAKPVPHRDRAAADGLLTTVRRAGDMALHRVHRCG